MADGEFPGRLPAGFREIWRALRAADEASASRQVLARDLGISTHTIQRILVDGDVPDLAGTPNTRVLRAWVRIIARLAHRFGRDARAWVEAVGIPWDDVVAGVVEEAQAKIAAGEGAAHPGLGAVESAGGAVPRIAGYDFPEEIELGIATGAVDSKFLGAYTTRLVGAIRPDCRIRVTVEAESELAARLAASVPDLELAAGIVDSTRRRMAGLDFVDISGIRVRLSAICLRKRGGESVPPGWYEAVSPGSSSDNKYMVLGDEDAAWFLRGQCGIADESLIVREPANLDEVADALVRESSLWESSMHRERWVFLVANEEICLRVERALAEIEDVTREYSIERITGAPQDFPAFQAAIALPARCVKIRDLLRAATAIEVFGSAAAHTARLYAGFVARGFMDRNLGNLINPSISRGPHVLADFAGASAVFRAVLCSELVCELEATIGEVLSARGIFKTPEAVRAQAAYLAAEHARNLVPDAWKTSLDGVSPESAGLVRGDVLRIPARHCMSCSASLLDEAHRGVSDRYCRICSDETGRLRPRSEVTGILAKWFAQWHGGLQADDALRQAEIFMDRMPAWCNN